MFDGCEMRPPLFCPFRAADSVESQPRAALRGYRRYALPWAGLLRPFRPKTRNKSGIGQQLPPSGILRTPARPDPPARRMGSVSASLNLDVAWFWFVWLVGKAQCQANGSASDHGSHEGQ
jgi:hypothetical protein